MVLSRKANLLRFAAKLFSNRFRAGLIIGGTVLLIVGGSAVAVYIQNAIESRQAPGESQTDTDTDLQPQPIVIDDTAVTLAEKSSGYCRALAPDEWAFVTNAQATGADLFSPEKSMHAAWGISSVYYYMYPTVDSFLNTWMPLAGYTGFELESSFKDLGDGFTQRGFTSEIGKKGLVIYKTYEFDSAFYVVSVYFAAADNEIWESKGATPTYAAISIRCVSQLRPTTSGVSLPSSDPSSSRDNPEVSLSDKWTEAIMGYENVYSPSTGEHYEAPLNSYWDTGPDGAGYYRSLPGGDYERLESGFGDY
ncbi:hypothetical protein A2890_02060 [candidate division WWE3 bacterium RIFCSPLOWO2_01_FULL_53_14]|uniref:Uncharacterized protein n=1 Tax=candidate division WWE3 bacterium RIFCSPLOWO2_01_FULL_53_14 TaxID=1802628 RepID=A0A1F4VRR3_UNCKA|nr:MAG: hypothetical protein A2890_02060 [candidate division WWE3 bacterium RIFCSPLOWO2_01_FULL_53_14]